MLAETETGDSPRRIQRAGYILIVGLLLRLILSWMGAVRQPIWGSRILLFVSLAIPAIFYVRAIGVAQMVSIRKIVAFGVIFALIGFVTLPSDSTDVFYYMAQGWQQAQYEANPYTQLLRDVPNLATDPIILSPWSARNLNNWLELPLPYGFLFAVIVRVVATLGQGNWWLTLGLFSLLHVTAHGVIVWLVWRLSHIMRFSNPNRAVFLYAWNPFVLAHSMGELHNDMLMGMFVVVAVYCLASRRPRWVLAALVAGGLIKYIALALIPFAAIAVYRMFGARALAISATIGIALAAVLAAPYVSDASLFKLGLIAGQMTESTGSLHSFVVGLLKMMDITVDRFPDVLPRVLAALQVGLWLAFAIFAVREMRDSLSRSLTIDRIVVRWTGVLAFILFVSSSQLYAWYIGMLLPLAVLAYESWVGRAVIAASAAHLFGFTDLKGKRIGYFIFCTLVPFVLTLVAARREKAGLQGIGNRRIPSSAVPVNVRP